MKSCLYLFCLAFFLFNSCTQTGSPPPSSAHVPQPVPAPVIERLDPAFDALIAPGTQVEVLADSFAWSEGPLWVPALNALLFTDIPNNAVNKWSEKDGISLYLQPSGYTGPGEYSREPGANGLLLDAEGRLVLCQHGNRVVARMDVPIATPKAEFTALAARYMGKKFNSPNDAVFHPVSGELYFTDPPYGLPQQEKDSTREIDFQGVYRVTKTGDVELLTDELTRPNGIAFSPDGAKLYVANSDPDRAIWMVYDIGADGRIANGKVLFDATPLSKDKKGLPDGLKVDARGNLFATGPGGVLVFSAEGKHLGTINTGQATANCAFGNDGQYLYMTAHMFLMRVKLGG